MAESKKTREAKKPVSPRATSKAPSPKAPKKSAEGAVGAAGKASKASKAPKSPASPVKAKPKKSLEPGEEARRTALAVAEAGLDKKALEVVILDVRGKVDYADFVVVMSGRSDRQVSAICKGVENDLREKLGIRCLAVEGLPQAQWALLDFGDVVVHVFHEDVRGYYDLETLWMDAARVKVEAGPPKRGPA